jgi:hypothetical protein
MGNESYEPKKSEIIGVQHKQLFIVFVTIAIVLALFGFVILHVALNSTGNILYFFAWPIDRIVVADLGFLCLGASVFIVIIIFLEFMINTREMVKIRKREK